MATWTENVRHWRCDECGTLATMPASEKLPPGWRRVDATCYGSDHYYKDGYRCTKEACSAECAHRLELN